MIASRFRTRLRDWWLGVAVRMIRNTPRRRLASVPALMLLATAWGNVGYGGSVRLLRHICRLMSGHPGEAILECGSGASTLLMGLLAERHHWKVYSLEHDVRWAAQVKRRLEQFGLDRVEVIWAPLRSYGEYTWYRWPDEVSAQSFAAVVCDGPPSATEGGRYGLLPVAGDSLVPNCRVVLDDTHRSAEKKIVDRWRGLRQFETQSYIALKGFTEIRFG